MVSSGSFFKPFSQSLSPRIDDLVNDYVAHHQFMGTVLVAEKSKVVFAKGYGLADVDRNTPNTPATKFMIGSITKQFTAMLMTQLLERGKIRLENTISDFIPGFPEDIGKVITVEMLLNHTAGLPLPEGIEKYYYVSRKEEFVQEYLKQLSEEGLRFDPGKGYAYSNAGYYILGLIIEKVTGKSYEEVLRGQILDPLSMADTGCAKKGQALANEAVSYQKLPDRSITWNEDVHSYDPGVVQFSAGYMYSTVWDLFKFSMAISSNTLLSRQYTEMYLKMRNFKSEPPISNISPAAVGEYLRLVDDTERFIVPGQDYVIDHGRQFAEMGDLDSAILILQTAVSRFPQSWQAYDALGDAYWLKKIPRRRFKPSKNRSN